MQRQRPHASSDGRTLVAEGSVVTVEACACGVFHLHFGPVSMRFTEEGLEDMQRTITEALVRVNAPGPMGDAAVTPLFSARGTTRGSA